LNNGWGEMFCNGCRDGVKRSPHGSARYLVRGLGGNHFHAGGGGGGGCWGGTAKQPTLAPVPLRYSRNLLNPGGKGGFFKTEGGTKNVSKSYQSGDVYEEGFGSRPPPNSSLTENGGGIRDALKPKPSPPS